GDDQGQRAVPTERIADLQRLLEEEPEHHAAQGERDGVLGHVEGGTPPAVLIHHGAHDHGSGLRDGGGVPAAQGEQRQREGDRGRGAVVLVPGQHGTQLADDHQQAEQPSGAGAAQMPAVEILDHPGRRVADHAGAGDVGQQQVGAKRKRARDSVSTVHRLRHPPSPWSLVHSGRRCAADGTARPRSRFTAPGSDRPRLFARLVLPRGFTADRDSNKPQWIWQDYAAPDGEPPAADSFWPASSTAATSGPSSRSRRKPASSRTGTPSSTALSCFEPGFSPTTTYEVFFDTDPDTFAPAACAASLAPSRVKPVSVPVMTMVRPASGLGPVSAGTVGLTPAASQRSTISLCQSTANHSTMDCAMV